MTRSSGNRAGMTLIEVIISVMILSGVLIGLSTFTRRFQHLTNNHDALAIESVHLQTRLAERDLVDGFPADPESPIPLRR